MPRLRRASVAERSSMQAHDPVGGSDGNLPPAASVHWRAWRFHPLTGPRRFDIAPGPWASDAIRIRKPNVVLLIQTKYGPLPHHRHSYGRPLASGRGRSLWVRSRLLGCGCSNGGIPCHESSHCLCGVWLRGCCVLFVSAHRLRRTICGSNPSPPPPKSRPPQGRLVARRASSASNWSRSFRRRLRSMAMNRRRSR